MALTFVAASTVSVPPSWPVRRDGLHRVHRAHEVLPAGMAVTLSVGLGTALAVRRRPGRFHHRNRCALRAALKSTKLREKMESMEDGLVEEFETWMVMSDGTPVTVVLFKRAIFLCYDDGSLLFISLKLIIEITLESLEIFL